MVKLFNSAKSVPPLKKLGQDPRSLLVLSLSFYFRKDTLRLKYIGHLAVCPWEVVSSFSPCFHQDGTRSLNFFSVGGPLHDILLTFFNLEKYKCVFLQFCRLEAQHRSHRAKITVMAEPRSLLESLGENSCLAFSGVRSCPHSLLLTPLLFKAGLR